MLESYETNTRLDTDIFDASGADEKISAFKELIGRVIEQAKVDLESKDPDERVDAVHYFHSPNFVEDAMLMDLDASAAIQKFEREGLITYRPDLADLLKSVYSGFNRGGGVPGEPAMSESGAEYFKRVKYESSKIDEIMEKIRLLSSEDEETVKKATEYFNGLDFYHDCKHAGLNYNIAITKLSTSHGFRPAEQPLALMRALSKQRGWKKAKVSENDMAELLRKARNSIA